ncbi:YbgA family protein [Nitrosopumilus sp.]|uniref:YbgA family protein n=1 Tax=Nitrosopumilus sp. TaxID=2024843 RepID=UPI002603CF82|nr:YbgA family protein [Nitrosopumilus sp.]
MKKQGKIHTEIIPVSEKNIIAYVLDRFKDVKNEKKMKKLVTFQTTNKYMIMSHDQEELKKLGNIVASNKKIKFQEILNEYETHLKKALYNKPTIKKHSNVILHIFGYFSNHFNQQEKEKFFDLLTKFKKEKITIGEILAEINPIIFRFNNTYLASQTYFLLYANPEPGNLFK